ncbi:interferon regulatory factor 4 isoform X1 [Gadus morhua]|uniref:interferon regulatory factor 4 isoform X1 n=1 Tax=Gadus morhua TaxID=8049 RepID=UPI0011B4C637|nr:interferon regulatory factor 4-like isoform X1 [Gadus morhua]
MNLEADYTATGSSGNGKLRQWLIDQVDSGTYPGLIWENDEKSIFRIPWKHAGKQDYNRDEDAALFKAWALFKGKFREGIDKADPPTWKTRLRCALNKSNDFEELVDRSQLDISDPYKVYRIIPEGDKRRPRQEDSPLSPLSYPSYPALHSQIPHCMPNPESGWREFYPEQAFLPELHIPQCSYPPHPWQGPPIENAAYQIKGSFYSYTHADVQPSAFTLDPGMRPADPLSDLRLHVSVFSRDALVREVTISNPKGCHLIPWALEEKAYVSPGAPDLVPLPPEGLTLQRMAGEEGPPSSLAMQGVRLWMTPEGLYARRQCQESVYWKEGVSPYKDKLNEMEREVNCKVLDTQDFLTEIQSYGLHGRPIPPFQALLCFGDECVDTERPRRSLTVQVEPLFARQLFYYAQQTGGHYYRGYEHHGVPEHISPSEDYQRAISHHHHHHGSMMQE